jgi:hypothetical protein
MIVLEKPELVAVEPVVLSMEIWAALPISLKPFLVALAVWEEQPSLDAEEVAPLGEKIYVWI